MAGEKKIMRPSIIKLVTTMAIITALTLSVGCGSDTDILEELGFRYRITTVAVEDNNASTEDIDMFASTCTGTAVETITKSTMAPTFGSVASTTASGTIYQIDVNFSLVSYTGVAPNPDLTDFSLTDLSIIVPANGGTVSDEFDLITLAEKIDYAAAFSPTGFAVFKVTVKAYLTYTPGDVTEHLVLPEYSFQINVGNINNCPAATP